MRLGSVERPSAVTRGTPCTCAQHCQVCVKRRPSPVEPICRVVVSCRDVHVIDDEREGDAGGVVAQAEPGDLGGAEVG
jgi:hypothetical protein